MLSCQASVNGTIYDVTLFYIPFIIDNKKLAIME